LWDDLLRPLSSALYLSLGPPESLHSQVKSVFEQHEQEILHYIHPSPMSHYPQVNACHPFA